MMTIAKAALVNRLGAILVSHTHGQLKVPIRVRRKIKIHLAENSRERNKIINNKNCIDQDYFYNC
jgi:hypothetical protein